MSKSIKGITTGFLISSKLVLDTSDKSSKNILSDTTITGMCYWSILTFSHFITRMIWSSDTTEIYIHMYIYKNI